MPPSTRHDIIPLPLAVSRCPLLLLFLRSIVFHLLAALEECQIESVLLFCTRSVLSQPQEEVLVDPISWALVK